MVDAARSAFWLTLAATCATLVSAYFAFPIHPAATVALAAFAVLAVWRLSDALLILAAFGPIAGVIHALSGLYYDGAALLEVFVLTLLGAAALRAARRRSPLVTTPFDAAVLGFAAVAAASCVAQMPTILAATVDPAAALWRLLRREYFLHEIGYTAVERTALLVEGAALAGLIARSCREPGTAVRLSGMLVLGVTAAAALNVHRLLEVSLRNPPFLESLWQVLLSLRLNTQFGDLNAAGSLFAMIAILAASRAGTGSRGAWLHLAAVPVLWCALWISGSRVALAATLLCTLIVLVARRPGGLQSKITAQRLIAGGAAVILLGILIVFLLPATRHGSFGFSVNTRVELLKVGARMMQDRPLFGVGTSRFYTLFPRYTSDELQRAFEAANRRPIPRENAHNQFVQFGAELGLAGIVSFVLLLIAAFRAGGGLPPRLPEAAALTGFLLTALAGHPLLIPLVSWPFWMMTGLVGSGGTEALPAARRRLTAAAITVVVALMAAMPLRWSLERRDADLAGVRAGFSPEWSRDEAGIRFQVAGTRSTVFVSRDAGVVSIPLRSADGMSHRVDVYLDGHPASSLTVTPDAWVDLVLRLPPKTDAPAYRRVDLIVADPGDAVGRLLKVGRELAAGY